jgi:hypothetical protein
MNRPTIPEKIAGQNMLKFWHIFAVSMAKAAILKNVIIAKALTHGAYRFCEVSSRTVQQFLRK